MSKRVLIVDDHDLFATALAELVDGRDGLEVVGRAADGAQAIALTSRLRPQVVLMDVDMPRVDGIDATRAITGSRPETCVVVVSGDQTAETAGRARAAGAAAYVFKGCPADELFAAVEDAAARTADVYAA